MSSISQTGNMTSSRSQSVQKNQAPAFLFDFDGTLVDSVYQHVLAWHEALLKGGIELSVWRIHRRIGMSGGLLVNAVGLLSGAYGREELESAGAYRAYNDPADLLRHLDEVGVR
jgi:phosphoglycolate phosphatase-like HAD superfamily hydrolase